MARGDFRSLTGAVIDEPTIKVQYTGDSVARFVPYNSKKGQALSMVGTGLQQYAEAGLSAEIRDKRETQQEAKYAERQAKAQAQRADEWRAQAAIEKYTTEMSEFLKNHAGEKLSFSQLKAKYKDELPALDLSEVQDQSIAEHYTTRGGTALFKMTTAYDGAIERGMKLEAYTTMLDNLSSKGSLKLSQAIKEGDMAGLSDSEKWAGIMSVIDTRALQGDFSLLNDAVETASKTLKDPELRSQVMSRLKTHVATSARAVNAKNTVADLARINKARTPQEVIEVNKTLTKPLDGEALYNQLKRAEKTQFKDNLKVEGENYVNQVKDYGRFAEVMTTKHSVEGQFGNYEINYELSDVESMIDKHFSGLLQSDPQQAVEVLSNTTKVPNVVKRSLDSLFKVGLQTGELDPRSQSFKMFLLANNATDGERAAFISKFKLNDDAKGVYTLYHHNKLLGMTDEQALKSAFGTVRAAKEYGTASDATKVYQKALGEVSGVLTPNQRRILKESAKTYALFMDEESAAVTAYEDAKSIVTEVGDYNIEHGAEFSAMVDGILADYVDVDINDVFEALGDLPSNSVYVYDPKEETLYISDTESVQMMALTPDDIRFMVGQKFGDKRLENVLSEYNKSWFDF
jgi:hypothetical protein